MGVIEEVIEGEAWHKRLAKGWDVAEGVRAG